MAPIFQLWSKNFTQLYPSVQINVANTGSGTGQAFVEQGLATIGGSSAYLSDAQQALNPNILNIPLAVTADLMEYNIPGFPPSIHLNFTASLLSMIYNSTVKTWNDPRITAINPGAAGLLPGDPIYPVYRSDAAGDTWMFTQYLSANDAWWAANVGYGLQVTWPYCDPLTCHVQSALGNPGIVIETGGIKDSLSYVSVEALDQWVIGTYHLGVGQVQNKDGNFVQATLENVKASIDALSPQTPPDERFSLVNAPGSTSYPIVGYGYALVNKQQINSEFAFVVRTFLSYCLSPSYGNSASFLNVYHFAPLPSAINQLSANQIAEIGP
jgi:phosphate transport system substrate-binding protein